MHATQWGGFTLARRSLVVLVLCQVRRLESAGDSQVLVSVVTTSFSLRLRFRVATLQILVLHSHPLVLAVASHAPNELLGTCFDDAWVAAMEANLSVSADARDARGKLLNPFLHAALKTARFRVDDPRTARARGELFQPDCLPPDAIFYGAGARVDSSGNLIDPGRVNGTLVLELNTWSSQSLSTMVFAIIAQELLGYDVSFLYIYDPPSTTQRMSSVGGGVCSPTHGNMEVWTYVEARRDFRAYSNESYLSGSVGYDGRAGFYTSSSFISDGLNSSRFSPTFSADFWRDYRDSEKLIEALRVSTLYNTRHYPPTDSGCADGHSGCLNSCSKSAACSTREGQGGECLVVIMMVEEYDTGYLQAVLANNGVPAYFCFLGIGGAVGYIAEALANNTPVAFYHFQPDEFHQHFVNQIERVALPWGTPESAALNTASFGEHGYGGLTDNPVRVDFSSILLGKYAAKLLTTSVGGVGSLMNRFALPEVEIESLLGDYDKLHGAATLSQSDAYFTSACRWLRKPESYALWNDWLDPLPVCQYDVHYSFTLEGCDAAGNDTEVFPRRVTFYWRLSLPGNASLPFNCDDEGAALPNTLVTSRSCEWLTANTGVWLFWASQNSKPACDSSFYTFDVSGCVNEAAQREVTFRWLLPDQSNALLSSECSDGDPLPEPVLLDCEYVPYDTPSFQAIAVLSSLLACLLLAGVVFVVRNRGKPVVKRSQHQFLVTMLFGGVLMCAATVMYGGPPSHAVCALRPMLVSWAFTLLFGSLVVKSLRVYRVFLASSMKRVVLSTATMLRVLGGFLAVDCLILGVWELVAPIVPTLEAEDTAELVGLPIERLRCTSGNSLFLTLLLFWKAALLALGLYLSFLIRKVSADFQESIWIFASAVAVLFASLLLLPMGYLVTMPPTTFFFFLTLALLSTTAIVIAFMLVPKMLRLQEQTGGGPSGASSSITGDVKSNSSSSIVVSELQSQRSARLSRASGGSGRGSKKDALRGSGRVLTVLKASAKVSVTPVEKFTAPSAVASEGGNANANANADE
ncbi:hypothetical protein BBJ28_00005101 [Nothophytophthora sp. Chile5]|nr:hypothetical protein BBJ28_00005101 [Nothophytophthora sp. Chile5]